MMAVVMSPIMTPVIVVPQISVATVIIALVRSLIVISVRAIVGTVIIKPEPSIAITKTVTPVASKTVTSKTMSSKTMASKTVTSKTPVDQFYSHAVFRLEPVKVIAGRC